MDNLEKIMPKDLFHCGDEKSNFETIDCMEATFECEVTTDNSEFKNDSKKLIKRSSDEDENESNKKKARLSSDNIKYQHFWSKPAILKLIKLVRANLPKFSSKMFKKKTIWTKITEELTPLDSDITPQMVEKKWRNLLQSYSKFVDGKPLTSESKLKIPEFFEEIREILKESAAEEIDNDFEAKFPSSSNIPVSKALQSSELISEPTIVLAITETNPIMTSTPTASSRCLHSWNRAATIKLIELVKENYNKLNNKMYKKQAVWTKIKEELIPLDPYLTREHVQKKWRNILQRYRKYQENKKYNENSTMKIPDYFKILDEFLEEKRVIVLKTHDELEVLKDVKLQPLSPVEATVSLEDVPAEPENPLESRDIRVRNYTWNRPTVLKLLKLVREYYGDLRNKTTKKKRVWIEISEELKTWDENLTKEIVEKKWRNLLQGYKKYFHYLKLPGASRMRLPEFFKEIHEILGEESNQDLNAENFTDHELVPACENNNSKSRSVSPAFPSLSESTVSVEESREIVVEEIDENKKGPNLPSNFEERSIQCARTENLEILLSKIVKENIEAGDRDKKKIELLETELKMKKQFNSDLLIAVNRIGDILHSDQETKNDMINSVNKRIALIEDKVLSNNKIADTVTRLEEKVDSILKKLG